MPKSEIVANLLQTVYDIIPTIVGDTFGWTITENEEEEADLYWMDTGVTPEILQSLKSFQRINHFPGMYIISRKDFLGKNLNDLKKQMPQEFNFYPDTWILPRDTTSLRSQFNKKLAKTFIVKPEASSQGRGIFLTRRFEEIPEKCVVQRYMFKPFLIDNLKFDLRIYVLITGCDPLRIFLHKEGLVRFATHEYKPPVPKNLGDICSHLTNYAINKNDPNFVFNTNDEQDNVGHKRSLVTVLQQLKDSGEDTDKLMSQIKDIVIKTLLVAQPHLSHIYRSAQGNDITNAICFEILGFDILIDHNMRPQLLEVNHTPSFTADTPLDTRIKDAVITDSINLIDIKRRNRSKYYNTVQNQIASRSQQTYKQYLQERAQARDKEQRRRDRLDNRNLGGFELIYRAGNNDYYDNLQERIKAANQGVNGALPRRQRQEDPKPIPPRPRMVRKESNPPPPKQQPKPVQFQSFKKHPKPSPTEEPKYFSHVLRSPQSPVPNSILSEPQNNRNQEILSEQRQQSSFIQPIGKYIQPKTFSLVVPNFREEIKKRDILKSTGKDVLKQNQFIM